MAITILTDPGSQSPLHACKEGIFLKVRGTEYMLQTPTKSSVSFTFTQDPIAGQSLVLSILGGSYPIPFIALNTPRPSGSCYVRSVGQSLRDWIINNLFLAMNEIAVLNDFDFAVSGPSSVVTITSNDFKNYFLAATGTGFVTTNGSIGGSAGNLREDYNIRIRAHMNDTQQGVVFSVKSQWHYFKPVIENGNAELTVDMGEILSELFSQEDIPAENNQLWTVLSLSARKVYLKVSEHYGDEPENNPNVVTNTFRVVKGGRDPIERTEPLGSIAKPQFLTNRSQVYTDARLYDWLYFHEPLVAAGNKLFLRTRTQYVGGSIVERLTQQIIPSEQGRIVRVPCGFNQLELNTFSGTPIAYSCDIVVTNTSNVVTEAFISPIWFKLLEESDYRSGLQYFNTFGFLESIVLDGSANAVMEWSRRIERIEQSSVVTKNTHREIGYETQKELVLNVTTGPVNKNTWGSLGDLFLSKKLFFVEFIATNCTRFACQLDKGKTSLGVYNPDGDAFTQVPLTLKFTAEQTHSNPVNILDLN